MFVAASERADQQQAKLRAERQAEYNRFLEQKKTYDVHPRVQPKATLPVPPNLKGYEDQYFKESNSPEKFGPAANHQPASDRETKLQKQRQYGAELKQQAEQAAQRKREERDRERAMSREMMHQRGELNDGMDGGPYVDPYGYGPPPDYSPHGPPPGGPQGHYGGGGGGYPPNPQQGYGAPPEYDGGYRGYPSPGAAHGGGAPPPMPQREPPWREGGRGPQRQPSWPDQDPHHPNNNNNNAPMMGRGEPPPPIYVPQQPEYAMHPPEGPYGARGGDGPGGPSPSHNGYRRQQSNTNAGAMVFGDANPQGATRRSADQQRKAAYRAELEQQMAAAAERKAALKRRDQEEDAKFEQQAADAGFQVWGGGRGGGGAPLRDDAGNVLSDLNHVRQYHKEGGPGNNYQQHQRQMEMQEQQQQQFEQQQQFQGYQEPPQGGAAQRGPPPSGPVQGRQEIVGKFRSDNAYMLPQELEAKAKARKQMQDDLQQQIDAKRRAKEDEKRKEQEEERREMDRLAREQDQLKAAFEAEGKEKKAEVMREAEKMRALAEEAYIQAQQRKPQPRSEVGELQQPQPQGFMPQPSEPQLPPMPPSRGQQYPQHRADDPYGAVGGAEPEMGFYQQQQQQQQQQQHALPSPGAGARRSQRGLSSRGGGSRPRTAAEIARLKQEMATQNEEMKLQVQRQMREVADRQEHELRELRMRAEAAEQEVAEIKKVVKKVPSFGRRASNEGGSGGRRRWDEAPESYGESFRSMPVQDSVDLDASLRGDSRLIFPSQDSPGTRPKPRTSEMSISSMRPIPQESGAAGASAPSPRQSTNNGTNARSLSAARPPRSRLGTPLDPGSILAKNEDRAKYLDELDARKYDSADPEEIKANSDSLDDLLLKFVDLEQPSGSGAEQHPPAVPAHGRPPSVAATEMSLRGDSEWIMK